MRGQQVPLTEEKEVVKMQPQAVLTAKPKWLTELEDEVLGVKEWKWVAVVPEKEVFPGKGVAGWKECIWMKLGVVSHRICTKFYQCATYELHQAIEDAEEQGWGELIARGEALRQRIVAG